MALDQGRVAADGPARDVLNSELLRRVFEVEACISGSGDGTFIDYLAPLQSATTAR